jgi:glutamate racemase
VIGTEGTIRGGAYQTAIHRRSREARVTSCACSMFVALAEEGWTEGQVAEAVAHRYLDPIFDKADSPDCLVLGCTHFPVLIDAMRAAVPAGVRIVDSAATTAAALWRELETRGGNATGAERGRLEWLATDDAQRFARVGSRFFGEALRAEAVEVIDL